MAAAEKAQRAAQASEIAERAARRKAQTALKVAETSIETAKEELRVATENRGAARSMLEKRVRDLSSQLVGLLPAAHHLEFPGKRYPGSAVTFVPAAEEATPGRRGEERDRSASRSRSRSRSRSQSGLPNPPAGGAVGEEVRKIFDLKILIF